MLRLYNTLTRKKEIFKPIEKNKIGVYTCGPTVYSYPHIGNLRSYIFSDILKRVLLYNGYKVKHVMNVTDVGHLISDADIGEDKIEKAAEKEGKKAGEIANYYLKIFKDDFKKLNILSPDIWCKATEHIKEQIELIKILEKKGFTYKTDDGVYFDTSKLKDYGKLARLKIEDLKAGKRVDMRDKKNKTDFALWKFSEEPRKRQQEWQSPWGVGFPGWHIECSAMSMKYLGEHIDIHTGGEDHISVHHTNEIAQSEAATGKKFVNYWLHGAFLTFKGKKISKSKGGLYTISKLEEKGFEPLVYRYLILTAHYRKQLDFNLDNLENAKNSYQRLKNIISKIKDDKENQRLQESKILDSPENSKSREFSRFSVSKISKRQEEISDKKYLEEFEKAINDDLDMTSALAVLWNLIRDKKAEGKINTIKKIDEIFGLDLLKKEKIKIPEKIKGLIVKREKARKEKDWGMADEIREKIKKLGYLINDTKEGAKLERI
ncbi:MAG: cysteine--tRNA ligase [Nanoarchaeota archaeon]|nr:cysteine--tRNA ligase [Nanoarchaeota archaeon]